MNSGEHHRVVRSPRPDMIHADAAPEIGGVALFVADRIEILLAGEEGAAYLERLSSVLGVVREYLQEGR